MPRFFWSSSLESPAVDVYHASSERPQMNRRSSSLRFSEQRASGRSVSPRRRSSQAVRNDVASFTTSAYSWPMPQSSSPSPHSSCESLHEDLSELALGRSLSRPPLSRASSTSSSRSDIGQVRRICSTPPLSHAATFSPPFTNPFATPGTSLYTPTDWAASLEDISMGCGRGFRSSSNRVSSENHLSFLIPRCLPRKPAPAVTTDVLPSNYRPGFRSYSSSNFTSSPPRTLTSSSGAAPGASWASIAGRGVQSQGTTVRAYSSTAKPDHHQNNDRAPKHNTSSNSEEMIPGEEGAKRRKTEHTPRTGVEETEIYVLTIWIGRNLQETMDDLRRRHFPPARQKTPSHISFFRALPGSKLESMAKDIDQVCRATKPLSLSVGKVNKKRRGVFVLMDRQSEKQCQEMRGQLLRKWDGFLSEQDREERWSGHWTIINKAEEGKDSQSKKDKAEHEAEELHGKKDKLEGLMLWKFEEHGTWVPYRQFRLGSGAVEDGKAQAAEANHKKDQQ